MSQSITEAYQQSFEVVYRSNVDPEATYEKLYPMFRSFGIKRPDYGVRTTERGLLQIQLGRTVFQISSKGSIQVWFRSREEKKKVWRALTPLLVPLKNERLWIRPIGQNPGWIPFPTPRELKLCWCDLEEIFERKKRQTMMDTKTKIDFALFSILTLLSAGFATYILSVFF